MVLTINISLFFLIEVVGFETLQGRKKEGGREGGRKGGREGGKKGDGRGGEREKEEGEGERQNTDMTCHTPLNHHQFYGT